MPSKFLLPDQTSFPYAFLTPYLLLLLILPMGLVFQEKGYWELWINGHHLPLLDLFFKTITNLGDGLVVVFLILVLILQRYGYGILLAAGFIIHGVLIHLGKQVFFNGSLRPVAYFEGIELHRVEGVKTALFNTFPSGHTASIFLFVMVLLLTQSYKQIGQVGLLFLAVVVAFSRVYLLQHSIWDVYAGSLVGVFSAFAALYLYRMFPNRSWMDKRLKIVVPKVKLPAKAGWRGSGFKG